MTISLASIAANIRENSIGGCANSLRVCRFTFGPILREKMSGIVVFEKRVSEGRNAYMGFVMLLNMAFRAQLFVKQ
jgi:hypothetical protein